MYCKLIYELLKLHWYQVSHDPQEWCMMFRIWLSLNLSQSVLTLPNMVNRPNDGMMPYVIINVYKIHQVKLSSIFKLQI